MLKQKRAICLLLFRKFLYNTLHANKNFCFIATRLCFARVTFCQITQNLFTRVYSSSRSLAFNVNKNAKVYMSKLSHFDKVIVSGIQIFS